MKYMVLFLIIVMLFLSCSSPDSQVQTPKKWIELGITTDGLVEVESNSDENGFYAKYAKTSREVLIKKISENLVAVGYKQVGTAFDGYVLGFAKGEDKLALKVDQFGEDLYLALFNEKGKEPLLHGVVFEKYSVGERVTGDEAKDMLRQELNE